MRRFTPFLAIMLAACADTATDPGGTPSLARIHEAEGSHGGTPFMATLVPGTTGDPSSAAGGLALMTLNSGQEEVCFQVSWSNLSAPVSNAHIHRGAAGVDGPVVVPFAQPEYPAFPATMSGSVARCVFADRELVKEIRQNPENFYVNVHTRSTPLNPATDRPAGAIRGQLTKTQGSNVNHG
jgi:hypothetical protein